jgi:MFS family permease
MTHPHFSRSQLRRAVLSSYLGSVIEYYDFLLYATASAVVFSQVFFSDLDPLVGTVASFGTLATGYIARPLGGIVFGHFGDRIGRKKMLIISMVMMGVGSTLIGLLPTYAQIGVWAPILLVLLRVVQGFAVGGEWGGAVLMSAEHASSRRGLWASFTNAGAPSGVVLSTLVLAASASLTGEQEFLACCWPSACSCARRSLRHPFSPRRPRRSPRDRPCSRSCATTRATSPCRSGSASGRSSPRPR